VKSAQHRRGVAENLANGFWARTDIFRFRGKGRNTGLWCPEN